MIKASMHSSSTNSFSDSCTTMPLLEELKAALDSVVGDHSEIVVLMFKICKESREVQNTLMARAQIQESNSFKVLKV